MFGADNFVPLVLVNLLGIAGIVVWHIQGGNRPTGRLIVQILFFTNMSLVLYLGVSLRIGPTARRVLARCFQNRPEFRGGPISPGRSSASSRSTSD